MAAIRSPLDPVFIRSERAAPKQQDTQKESRLAHGLSVSEMQRQAL